jgi:hypothetical protein
MGEGGEHSGVFGFVGELTGGELRPTGAVAIAHEGGSREKGREGLGCFRSWAKASSWADSGHQHC